MDDLKRISIKQLVVISKIFCEIKLFRAGMIRDKFKKNATGYDNLINVLRGLELVNEKDDYIMPSGSFKGFLDEYSESDYSIDVLRQFFVNVLLLGNSVYAKYVDEFLSNFILESGEYVFRATTFQKVKYGGVRNLLLELGLIGIDDREGYYVFENHVQTIDRARDKRKVSPKAYEEEMKRKAQLGHKAELEVIKYETSKLAALPALIKKIEHTSALDVSAGYDITSYKDELDLEGNPIPIFIEVKAVSHLKYEFHWSGNEIEQARILGGEYYLYLLPVIRNNMFDLDKMIIIRNPYRNVYKSRLWNCAPEARLCSSIKVPPMDQRNGT